MLHVMGGGQGRGRWYVPVEPPPELARLLACSWTAEPTGMHTLVPDGCIDVLWVSTGHLVVCGPETRAWSFALPTGTTAVGVRLRPGVGPQLLGFDASALVDRRVSLCSLIGDDRALLGQVARASDAADRRAVLESFIDVLADDRGVELSFTDAVIDYLVTESHPTVHAIARHVGLTERQVHRRSQAGFGYGTKTLGRLLRFQRFLALGECEPGRTLTSRALDAGYSDHAHLSRDCRAITSSSPTQFLRQYFPTFPNMSDPFKTEHRLIATMGR